LGAEGSIGEAISGRHIYVYGTGGNPSREETQATGADQAAKAADWVGHARPIALLPARVADRDVRPSDLESSNLVLFGRKKRTPSSQNSTIGCDSIGSGAAGYGLVYVFPIDQHYVVVSSGLPWWTPPPGRRAGAGRNPSPGLPVGDFLYGGTAQALTGLQGLCSVQGFRGDHDCEGRFDNGLAASEADAEKAAGERRSDPQIISVTDISILFLAQPFCG